MEAKVVDLDGKIVAPGQRGELCIRGYCVMLNYWNDDAKTDEVLSADRWYRTGYVNVTQSTKKQWCLDYTFFAHKVFAGRFAAVRSVMLLGGSWA